MNELRYIVHLCVGYRDAEFAFDDGSEAMAFAESLFEHMIYKADDEDKKVITIRLENMLENTKEDK